MMGEEETVRRILEIEAEQRRRAQENALARYNAGRIKHKKQIAFHRCKKRNRWVFGGNRSGKTECGAVECVYMARGVHPYRKNRRDVFGWVVSLSQQVQRDVAQKKIFQYLAPEWIEDVTMLSGRKGSPSGVVDQIRVRNVFGGISVIGFKSCDQGREKFQGASLDFVWFDEEPPQDVYEECRMRVLDRAGDIFGTMTPLKGMTFVYDEIYMNRRGDPEVWYEFMEWADNPYLDKREVKLMSGAMDDKALASRRYGRFAVGEGLVYPEFDERVHVIPPFALPADWQDVISIDPGLHNPLRHRLPRRAHPRRLRPHRLAHGRQGAIARAHRPRRQPAHAGERKERRRAVLRAGHPRGHGGGQGPVRGHRAGQKLPARGAGVAAVYL